MSPRPALLSAILTATLLSCLSAQIRTQELPHPDDASTGAGHLSEPLHIATYTEANFFDGMKPNWNHGYLAHLTGKTTPGSANVGVYDRDGKHVVDARIWFPGAVEIRLIEAVPLEGGGVLASGFASTDEGTANFIAKTDTSGNVIAVVRTETFWPARVCEQPHGTVWVFGRDIQKESANDSAYSLLRQYNFEKGLLHSYLSRDSVALRTKAVVGGGGPQGSYLNCGKNMVSLYLNQTDEFVQVDAAEESVQRWKMDMSPITSGKVTGLGVTESGRIYASLYAVKPDEIKAHGLFVLQAESGKPMGSWIPVMNTLNSHRDGETVRQNTFWRLWGTDGENLVIGRQYDPNFSWVRVVR